MAIPPFWRAFVEPKHRPFTVVQAIGTVVVAALFVLLWFKGWRLPVGIAAVVISVLAAIMSLQQDMKGPHKALWMLSIGAFLALELVSISKSAREETAAREAQTRQFDQIVTGLTTAIEGGKTQFQTTMNALSKAEDSRQKQFGTTIAKANDIMLSTTEAKSFASGGDSWPLISAGLVGEEGSHQIGFYLSRVGKYPLYDVDCTIGRLYKNSASSVETWGPRRSWSEIDTNVTMPLFFDSVPHGVAYYSASITARNGEWETVIEVVPSENKISSHVVTYAVSPPNGYGKKILDVSDSDFPASELKKSMHPIELIPLLPNSPGKPMLPSQH